MKGTAIGLFVVLLVTVVALGVWLAIVTDRRPAPASAPTAREALELEQTGSDDTATEGAARDAGEERTELVGRVARLSAVAPYSGSGRAVRVFNGDWFVQEVRAEIPDPPDGKFYEGWLVRLQPEAELVSTGRLEKRGDTYSLTFQSGEDLSAYSLVVVTEETEEQGLDGVPEAHVLEGVFDS